MTYEIHNAFSEKHLSGRSQEELEALQSAASDVEFFFNDDAILTAILNLQTMITNQKGEINDILEQSESQTRETLLDMLMQAENLYEATKEQTLANIQGYEEWSEKEPSDREEHSVWRKGGVL